MQMAPASRLAVLTALEKAVKEQIKLTRAEVDETAWSLYEDMGVEKTAMKIDGEKVGEVIMTFAKEGWDVTNPALFEEFALDYGFAKVRRTIRPDMTDSVISALLDAGYSNEVISEITNSETVVDADWEKYVTNVGGMPTFLDSGLPMPGVVQRPKRPKGTMVRGCKPADVIPMVNRIEGGVNALLLGEAS